MKRVLFVIPGLDHGGTNKSLKNLLGLMDSSGIQVQILALHAAGPYQKDFEQYLLPSVQAMTEAFGTFEKKNGNEPCLAFLQRLWWKLIYVVIYRRVDERLCAAVGRRLKYAKFDTVVAFQESTATVLSAHIPALKRIAWVRCDYKNYLKQRQSRESEENIYIRFDHVICVSEFTAEVFRTFYPGLADRVLSIHNMIDTKAIQSAALESIEDARFRKAAFTLVSVGRFAPEKRFAEIPAMAAYLKKRGIPFVWYIIGDGGSEKAAILNNLEKEKVSDRVILLGEKMNPYPYILSSDVLVCPSFTEACPNVVNEAKILHVPVVAADFPAAKEYIENDVNGIIAPIEQIAPVLAKLFSDKQYYKRLKDGISTFEYDNEEIKKRIEHTIYGETK